jgi:DegV family protein with EDD domain
MVVKVVTDSCADISPEIAKELGIVVIPVYLRFGERVYRDGVDIQHDEFYKRLSSEKIHPNTAAPSPGDIARIYEEVSREADDIVSIHVTSKHSAVYNTALVGKTIAEKKGCHIEVIDSKGVTIWQGLVATIAAKAAQAGGNLKQVLQKIEETRRNIRILALLDTLKYVIKGGRLHKTFSAVSTIESLLKIKILITLRDGEVRPVGFVRTRSKGIRRLLDFIKSAINPEDIGIAYSTTMDDADELICQANLMYPDVNLNISRLSPALGVHAGPGALVTLINDKRS